jgi:hypothetical protein
MQDMFGRRDVMSLAFNKSFGHQFAGWPLTNR